MKKLTFKKNLLLVGVALGIAALFGSCEKDGGIVASNTEKNAQIETLSIQGVKSINGTLYFASSDAYFAATESLANASSEQRKTWEESLGFKSLNRSVNEVYKGLSESESDADYDQIISENSDIVSVEDGLVKRNVPSLSYALAANRSGVFYVEGVTHVVKGDKIAMSLTKDAETLISALGSSLKSNDPEIEIESYVGESKSLKASCPTEYDESCSTSDRKVRIILICYSNTITLSNGGKRYSAAVATEMIPYYKSVFGKWKTYATSMTIRNYKFTVVATPYTFKFPAIIPGTPQYFSRDLGTISTPSDTWDWVKELKVGSEFTQPLLVGFTKVNAEGTSRGVGDKYAVISCGY